MTRPDPVKLSRRERQILDALYRLGQASVAEVHGAIENAPGSSSVRKLLGILEEKGYISHRRDGKRYVYRPNVPKSRARQSAVRQMVRTFFDGSTSQAVLALLGMNGSNLSDEEMEEIAARIEQAREKGQ